MDHLLSARRIEERGGIPVTFGVPGYQAPSATTSRQFPHTIFASISMHNDDRLRLLRFPSTDIEAVRRAINTSWPRGIQDTRKHLEFHEFKLKGNPWSGRNDEAIFARRMMREVLETLSNNGWMLMVSADISKKTTEKDTLIFRYQHPPPAPCNWMSISFSLHDRIRLIDAPDELIHHLISSLARFIQRHKRHTLQGTYELQIHGHPWLNCDQDAQVLLLQLLEGLDVEGWTVYASISQKTGPIGDTTWSEPDTWHCCRGIGWTPDLPVYHN